MSDSVSKTVELGTHHDEVEWLKERLTDGHKGHTVGGSAWNCTWPACEQARTLIVERFERDA
jgi:hypothetical protein